MRDRFGAWLKISTIVLEEGKSCDISPTRISEAFKSDLSSVRTRAVIDLGASISKILVEAVVNGAVVLVYVTKNIHNLIPNKSLSTR